MFLISKVVLFCVKSKRVLCGWQFFTNLATKISFGMSTPRVSIIICTYNREQFLPGLFDSIVAQTMPRELFETVLINNSSTDNTERLCRAFIEANPELRISYFVEERLGLSYARNRGIGESRGEYLTFADDDAIMAEDFCTQICRYLDNNEDVGEVGGPAALRFLCEIPRWHNRYLASLFGYFEPSKSEYKMKGRTGDYPRGLNMSFRRTAFERCGDFDITLGRIGKGLLGGEEKDIAFRVMDSGFRVGYSPKIKVEHLVPAERTTTEFIRRQALGTGFSERLRSRGEGTYPKRLLAEAFKWAATLVLWVLYMLSGRAAAANMLVRFRFWVSRGLLNTRG